MAKISCPECGGSHNFTATALATLLRAALAGELHTVGRKVLEDGERVVQIRPRCLLSVVPVEYVVRSGNRG